MISVVVSLANLTAREAMPARLLGVTAGATTIEQGAIYVVYRELRGTRVLEAYLVPGIGYAWSGGDARATHTFLPGPPATELMLDFLVGPR